MRNEGRGVPETANEVRIDKWLWAGAPNSLATQSPGLGSCEIWDLRCHRPSKDK